ncbi:hypothetical protein JCM16161A_16730 [Vulcanisaeta sp. JCM 16161]
MTKYNKTNRKDPTNHPPQTQTTTKKTLKTNKTKQTTPPVAQRLERPAVVSPVGDNGKAHGKQAPAGPGFKSRPGDFISLFYG